MMKRWSGYDFRYSGIDILPYYYFNPELNKSDGIIGREIMTVCQGLNLSFCGVERSIPTISAGKIPKCRRVEPPDGLMGQIQLHENGSIKSISGILQELYNNQTDIGAGAYWLSNDIYTKLVVPPVVRMSNFFLVSGMKKAYVTQPVNVALAYDVMCWVLMAIMILVSAAVLHVHNRVKNQKSDDTLKELFIFLQSFLQESVKQEFRTVSTRLLACFFFLGTFIFMQTFTSHSKAVMVVLSPTRRVETADDMFRYKVKTIYPRDTEYYYAVMMLSGSNPKVKTLLDVGHPVWLNNLLSENSRRLLVEGKGAIFTIELMIRFQCSIWCKTTNDFYYMSPAVREISSVTLISSMNPHLPKELIHDYAMSVLWLFATGHQFLPDDITFKSRFDCVPGAKNKQLDTAQPFDIRDFNGIFIIWTVTIGISLFAFIAEVVYYYTTSCCR